jgi:uncharacterized lipoprotein YmbA
VAAVWLALLALGAGCLGGGPPPEYFALRSEAGAGAGAPLAPRPDLGLAVGPLELPRYLERDEIVTRDASHQLVPWDGHRWAGSLRDDVLRVLGDDLGTLLGTTRVAVYPVEPRFPVSYRVLLDVLEFEGVPGQSVTLRVRWTVTDGTGANALAIAQSRVDQPVAAASGGDPAKPSFAALVAAQSAALGSVAREIAAKIAQLAAP